MASGGSASGKTSVAKKIIEGIDIPWVVLLSMDSFYKGISTAEDKAAAKRGDYNFDCPNGNTKDMNLLPICSFRLGPNGRSAKPNQSREISRSATLLFCPAQKNSGHVHTVLWSGRCYF